MISLVLFWSKQSIRGSESSKSYRKSEENRCSSDARTHDAEIGGNSQGLAGSTWEFGGNLIGLGGAVREGAASWTGNDGEKRKCV